MISVAGAMFWCRKVAPFRVIDAGAPQAVGPPAQAQFCQYWRIAMQQYRARVVILFSAIVGGVIAGCTTQTAPSTTSAPTVAPTSVVATPAATSAEPQSSVVKSDKNPLRNTAAAAAAGKPLFEANCVPCHGEKGKGDGPIAASLTTKPANLTEGDVPPKRLSAGFQWTGAPGPGCVNWRRGHAGAVDEAEKASATGTGS